MKNLFTSLLLLVAMITLGTQQAKADEGYVITWAAYGSWNAGTELTTGNVFETTAEVFCNGLTTEEGHSDAIIAEIGYGTSTDPTAADWQWNQGWFAWVNGSNYMYQAKTTAVEKAGTYYYTFRFKLASGGDYFYLTLDPSKTFTVTAPANAGYKVTWAELSWMDATTKEAGNYIEAAAYVFSNGLTDAETSYVQGDLPTEMSIEIGFGPTETPDAEWLWRGDNKDYVWFMNQSGSNWMVQGRTHEINAPGTYYIGYRFKTADMDDWFYATPKVDNKVTISPSTGINAINRQPSTANQIYNLAGQRVGKNYRGIAIINGKKVLMK